MTNPTPTDADDRTPTDADRRADLVAVLAEYDDRPDECTIYPAGASDEALVTEWLTAEEGSFVDLDAVR